jgi:hypothetical protein
VPADALFVEEPSKVREGIMAIGEAIVLGGRLLKKSLSSPIVVRTVESTRS